jgi:hypothetical protein
LAIIGIVFGIMLGAGSEGVVGVFSIPGAGGNNFTLLPSFGKRGSAGVIVAFVLGEFDPKREAGAPSVPGTLEGDCPPRNARGGVESFKPGNCAVGVERSGFVASATDFSGLSHKEE